MVIFTHKYTIYTMLFSDVLQALKHQKEKGSQVFLSSDSPDKHR